MPDRRLSKGWVVALAGFGINLALGVLYSWSIFAKALVAEWSWTTGQSSVPYAVAVASFATVLAFGGRAQDRYGPRLVATLGGVLMGSGLIVSSLAAPDRSFPLIMGFGVLTGSGIALGFVSTFPAAAKWFPAHRRGVMTGFVVSGFGIASVYIAPLTQYLLGTVSIQRTFLALGVGFLVTTTALAQLVRNPRPDEVPIERVTTAEKPGRCRIPTRDYDWHEMVRTRQFFLLWLMYGLTAFAGIMIIGHMAKITQEQLGVDLGFALVAVLALGNASGRIATGVISDHIGSERTMSIVFALQAAMMVFIGFAGTTWLLSAAAFVIGFNYGADLSLFPCIVYEYFGRANQGVNYGLVFTSWGVGGVFGSMVAGAIVDATGSYSPAFALAAGMCAIAAALAFFTKPPVDAPQA